MFEKTTIKHTGSIDLGLLTESMIFYKKVNLFCLANYLLDLLKVIDLDLLYNLIDQGHIDIYVMDSSFAAGNYSKDNTAILFKKITTLAQDSEDEHNFKTSLSNIFKERDISSSKCDNFLRKLKIIEIHDVIFQRLINDLCHPILTKDIFLRIIADFTEVSPANHANSKLSFFSEDGLIFKWKTNDPYLDFILQSYGQIPILIFTSIAESRLSVEMASFTNSSLTLLEEKISEIIQIKFEHIFESSTKEKAPLNIFKDTVIEVPDFRSAVNDNKLPFEKVGSYLLKNSDKFKNWLNNIDITKDTDLIKNYFLGDVNPKFSGSLPFKFVKWSLVTGISALLSPIPGAVLGFSDSFIVDKLLEGWRPNHFISGLNKLVDSK